MTHAPTRAAAAMGLATAVSRAMGAVRVLVVAAVLGTTYLGNTFQASNSVSNVLFELLAAGALSAVLVPGFVTLLSQGPVGEAERVAGGILGIALVGLGVVTVAGVAAAPVLAGVLTSAVDDPVVAEEQRELATFLLRFFVPQVLLYAVGAVATAALHARRVFTIPALAPIGNTVVVVAALAAFRAVAGADPGLDLALDARLLLAAGGTLGVAAFVAIPWIALARTGFRLVPRWAPSDAAVRRILRLSGWAVLQHAAAGALLGAAIVVGGAVEGGVVAYQVAFVVFLAPYAVLAQPVQTAILPELAEESAAGDLRSFGRSMRWAVGAQGVLTVPVAAAVAALALPIMTVLAFGQASDPGSIRLMAAALAGLGAGLPAYCTFLLLARGWYALGDSRTPATAAVLAGVLGVVIMVVAGQVTDGVALVAWLGVAHSAGHLAGAAHLARGLRRRLEEPVVAAGAALRAGAAAALLGLAAWWAAAAIDPGDRLGALALVAGVTAGGGALWLGAVRLMSLQPPARVGTSA